jgi:hypothetical protein
MEDQFETLESAHDFVALLAETVAEAKRELERDVQREAAPSRRLDALRIAAYYVDKLELHLKRSRRILNDLRAVRRLLFEERDNRSKRYPVEAADQLPSAPLRSKTLADESHPSGASNGRLPPNLAISCWQPVKESRPL